LFGQGDECESCDQGGDLEGGAAREGSAPGPFRADLRRERGRIAATPAIQKRSAAKESCLTQLSASLVPSPLSQVVSICCLLPSHLSGLGVNSELQIGQRQNLVRGIDPYQTYGLHSGTCTSCRVCETTSPLARLPKQSYPDVPFDLFVVAPVQLPGLLQAGHPSSKEPETHSWVSGLLSKTIEFLEVGVFCTRPSSTSASEASIAGASPATRERRYDE